MVSLLCWAIDGARKCSCLLFVSMTRSAPRDARQSEEAGSAVMLAAALARALAFVRAALKTAEDTFHRERDARMSGPSTRYDQIGHGYRSVRRPDARLAAAIDAALGDVASVANVGAGTGSYDPLDRRVVAVEPARTMLAQGPPGSSPAVQAVAERLPFADATFDAALAILTLHHWHDPEQGLRELRRVALRRVMLLTWDPAFARGFLLVRDYLPEILALDVPSFRPAPQIVAALGGARVETVPIPHDCTDGFLGAY